MPFQQWRRMQRELRLRTWLGRVIRDVQHKPEETSCSSHDESACKLQWTWKRKAPELKRSVFLIPAGSFKSQRPRDAGVNEEDEALLRGWRPLPPKSPSKEKRPKCWNT